MNFDVVVSGAGLVGICAAHTFAQQGYSTLLVGNDESEATLGNKGFDLRTVALAPVALNQMSELNVELPSDYGSIVSMHVWEHEGSAAIDICAADTGTKQLAAVFENHSLVQALLETPQANLTLHLTGYVTEVNPAKRELLIHDLGHVGTKFLVVAEGSNSSTVAQLNCRYSMSKDLKQSAIATVVELARPHDNIALQVFQPTPIALLPMSNPNLMSLVWSMPAESVNQYKQLADETFIEKLNDACAAVVSPIRWSDRRLSFPLHHRLVSDFNPLSWVLILGDAAHTIHPLAGQGVNLGLEDVRAVKQALQQGPKRLDHDRRWRSFNAKRHLRARAMLELMSLFSNIYANTSPSWRLLRNMGVRRVNSNRAIKRQIVREAMGVGPIASLL